MKRSYLVLVPPVALIIGFIYFNINQYPFPPDQGSSDFLITHLPNLIFLRTWIQQGIIPLWSNTIYSGYPFFANPLSGLWYLPGWIMLLFPIPSGVNVAVLLHMFIAGWGMYAFLMQQGFQKPVGLIGAAAFMFLPKIAGHYGAGHVSLVFSMAWLPWVMWSIRKSFEGRFGIFWASCFWALTILADVRWAAYTILLWGSFLGYILISIPKNLSVKNISMGLLPLVIGCGLSAVLILPLIEYTALSTRIFMADSDRLMLALPLSRLLGIFVPDMGGLAEWQVYSGGICAAFAFWAFFQPSIRRKTRFWWGVILVSLVFSTGLFPGLYNLPGISLLRVPPRILVLEQFGLIVIFSTALDFLLSKINVVNETKFDIGLLIVFSIGAILFVMGFGLWILTRELPFEFLWGGCAILAGMGILLWIKNTKQSNYLPIYFCSLLMVIDLGFAGNSMLDFHTSPIKNQQKTLVLQTIKDHAGDAISRVYSPSYSIPQYLSAGAGLEMADGIDPLQIAAYAQWMEKATGVPYERYAVSIPPFFTGEPSTEYSGNGVDARELGSLNVGFLVSAFPMEAAGLNLISKVGDTYVYENELVLPRFRLVDGLGEEIARPVDIQSYTPNKIALRAIGPATLISAEINYPGWYYQIDGGDLILFDPATVFRVANIPPGLHEVKFIFRPSSLYVGGVVTFLTFVSLVLAVFLLGKKSR